MEGKEGKDYRGRGKRGREGKWRNGEGKGKGEVGEIAPWLLGG